MSSDQVGCYRLNDKVYSKVHVAVNLHAAFVVFAVFLSCWFRRLPLLLQKAQK